MVTDLSNLTVAEFEAAAQRVVEAYPERRNPVAVGNFGTHVCVYRDGGEESCLVGHVLLHELNVEYSSDWENRSAGGVLNLLNATNQVKDAANRLQKEADQREKFDDPWVRITWADAWDRYVAFKERYNL